MPWTNDVITSTFGEQLRAYRARHGLTRRRLSEITGFAEVRIQTWEAGRTYPNYTSLIQLAITMEEDGGLAFLARDVEVNSVDEPDPLDYTDEAERLGPMMPLI